MMTSDIPLPVYLQIFLQGVVSGLVGYRLLQGLIAYCEKAEREARLGSVMRSKDEA